MYETFQLMELSNNSNSRQSKFGEGKIGAHQILELPKNT